MLDIFKTDAFSLISLTDAMNTLPYMPKRLDALFTDKPVATLSIGIEEKDGKLSLLSTKARGAAGESN